MRNIQYENPTVEVSEMRLTGVLCQSFSDPIGIGDDFIWEK